MPRYTSVKKHLDTQVSTAVDLKYWHSRVKQTAIFNSVQHWVVLACHLEELFNNNS